MQVIQLAEYGDPQCLTPAEWPTPTITKPTEVKVKLMAAGINPIDTKIRQGIFPINKFPAVLGCDGAGVIIETGCDVTRFKEGDAVYFFYGGINDIPGNYAEYQVLDERFIAARASNQSFIEAAASPLVLITAWEALFDRAQLTSGQQIFINAGAGGVGHVAIQLAKNSGARVCTTVSNQQKADFVTALGAECVINYKTQDVVAEIMAWTEGRGVDVALDNVGGAEIPAIFPAVKHYGHMVTLLLPDHQVDWTEARFRNICFSLEVMLSPLLFGLTEAQRHQTWILAQCAKEIEAQQLKVCVNDVLPLNQASSAHQLLAAGRQCGKIVLAID